MRVSDTSRSRNMVVSAAAKWGEIMATACEAEYARGMERDEIEDRGRMLRCFEAAFDSILRDAGLSAVLQTQEEFGFYAMVNMARYEFGLAFYADDPE